MERWESKAAELGKSVSWLRDRASRYERLGLWGLIDGRKTKLTSGPKVDERVAALTREVLDEYASKSNLSQKSLRVIVERRLRDAYGDEVAMPKRSTFERLLAQLTAGRGTFGAAKTRRNAESRPGTPYRRSRATRPGEEILIDTTRLDVFAMDPITFKWINVDLTAALDSCTATIPALSLSGYATAGIDACLLLYDIITPRELGDGWATSARLPYCGVPDQLLLPLGLTNEKLAGLPPIYPESVVVDGGGPFKSDFRDACSPLGISVRDARVRTPTGKAKIERFFRTLRMDLLEKLPGYKGPDIYSRGALVETEAFYFIDELEDLIREWVATVYHNTTHEGLLLPERPGLWLTPNAAYEEALDRCGFVYAPVDATLRFKLLPKKWRQIHHYGVDIDNLRYDGEALNPYRNTESPFGVAGNKWPFHCDPRDRSKAHFRDPSDGAWHPIDWVGNPREPRPFSATTSAYAKRLLVSRGGNLNNKDEMAYVLNEVLDRVDANAPARTLAERKALIREELQRGDIQRDRFPRSPASTAPEAVDSGHAEGCESSPNAGTNGSVAASHNGAGYPELEPFDEVA